MEKRLKQKKLNHKIFLFCISIIFLSFFINHTFAKIREISRNKIPAAAAPAEACDWTGTWKTSRGMMKLVQKGFTRTGADVTGTVSIVSTSAQGMTGSLSFQDVNIVSIAMDDKLVGTWIQPPTYGPPNDAGDIEFTISQDCNSFTGNWRHGYGTGQGTAWDGPWTAKRVGAAPPPPSAQPTTETVCASAKPSITEGSVFNKGTFTIGGSQPQKVRITQPARNFSIKEEYGKAIYQVIDGKSWGSLTLEPGTYVLSCNGGGAMGLMSALVCLAYTTDGTVSPGIPTPPSGPGRDDKP